MHHALDKARSSSTSRPSTNARGGEASGGYTRSNSVSMRAAVSVSSPSAANIKTTPRTHSPLTTSANTTLASSASASGSMSNLSGVVSGMTTSGANNTGIIKSSDMLKLAEENFDVESYIRSVLQQLPSEDAIHQLQQTLADTRDLAATDLQRNVFRNYNDFVIISKEISKLESDMLYLRGLLSELRDVQDMLRPDSMGIASDGGDGTGVTSPESQTTTGVLDDPLASPAQKAAAAAEALARQRAKDEELAETREAQMKALYTNIEGLQKMLPESRSRYLVRDGSKTRYWEINPVTYKQKDMVHLYLFNDALVVVSWKKSIITGKTRLVTDHHWNLSEIGFIDMKDSPDVTNAFKIVKHPDVNMYRAETLEEKRAIFGAIKRITDELFAQKRREKESKETGVTSSKSKLIATTTMTPGAPDDTKTQRQKQPIGKDNLSVTDFRWLSELPDELDVLIAHRDFNGAVTNIEKARGILATVNNETPRVQYLRSSIKSRTDALSRIICLDLASPVATKTQVQDNIDRLLHLGLGDQARDIFLSSRTKTIRHRTRQLKFDGDIASYMSDLAEVTFRLIRNTCDWYGTSFRDTAMASGFMTWVTSETIYFTDTLRRQVFDSKQSFSTIADCLLSTLDHCQQLREVGLDLTFLLDKIVLEDIVVSIDEHSRTCVTMIRDAIVSDAFEKVESRPQVFEERGISFDVSIPKMSESVYVFVNVLMDFASDVGVLMSMMLYNRIVSALTAMFCTYIEGMEAAISKDHTTTQYSTILTNTVFIISHMLPKVKSQLKDQFDRSIPELEEQIKLHTTTLTNIKNQYVSQCFNRIINHDYNFSKLDYTNSAAILDTTMPSDATLKFLYIMNKLIVDLDPCVDKKPLIISIIESVFNYMLNNSACWATDKGPRKFGFGGVQLLILDIHFTLRISEPFISEQSNGRANAVCERALRAYFAQNRDLGVPLKTGEWYDKRVDEASRKYGRNFSALSTPID